MVQRSVLAQTTALSNSPAHSVAAVMCQSAPTHLSPVHFSEVFVLRFRLIPKVIDLAKGLVGIDMSLRPSFFAEVKVTVLYAHGLRPADIHTGVVCCVVLFVLLCCTVLCCVVRCCAVLCGVVWCGVV